MDSTVIMLAITVILTSGPKTLPFGSTLFPKICRLYKNCLDSEHLTVQLKTLQSIASVFQTNEIQASFIRELGHSVFGKIRPYVVVPRDSYGVEIMMETDLPWLEDLDDSELLIIQETFKAVEAVLDFAIGEKGNFKLKQVYFLEKIFVNLLVRSLSRFLCPDPINLLKNCSKNVYLIHEFALKRMNIIGLKHSEVLCIYF